MAIVKNYEIGRIEKLAAQLEAAHIDQKTISKIMEGGKSLTKKSKPEQQVDWLSGAMTRMDELLDLETCKAVREGCACCLGGKRDKDSKAIARNNKTLEDRIKAANEAKFVFGHSVKMMKDGKVQVQFFPEGLESYRCPCMPQAQKQMPLSYCFCCGGHVKHHLQNALGRKLDCTVLYTARSSGGKKPCTFSFEMLD
jgi:hypothetical protein